LPQLPQLLCDVLPSMQPAPQSMVPLGQLQLPALQPWVPLQATPQAPQLAGSVMESLQVPSPSQSWVPT